MPSPANPVLPRQPKAPTEQDVYATATLYRALAKSAGATGGQASDIHLVADPPTTQAQLYQAAFLGYRGRPTG